MKANFKHIEDYIEQAENLNLLANDNLRQQAANDLQQFGFPALKTERWKYTSAKALLRSPYQLAKVTSLSKSDIEQWLLADSYHCILVNGVFSEALSDLPEGLQLEPINPTTSLLDTAQTGFSTLNILLCPRVYQLTLSGNIAKPIQMLSIAANCADETIMQHLIFDVQAEARADVLYQTIALDNASDYWRNNVCEVNIAENATFNFYQMQQESDAAKQTDYVIANQLKNSNFNHFNIDLGGQLVRHDIHTRLQAERATCIFNGLYMAHGKQHVDNHTTIEHLHRHTYSKEYYKGIVDEQAHAVFNGRVLVAQDAQKVDSAQKNANLLLSNECEIDTKPELEIYADDVKCAHGATVGQLDNSAVHYLQSRGIDVEIAKKLLTYGFANEVIETIEHNSIQQFIRNELAQWFATDQVLQELMQ